MNGWERGYDQLILNVKWSNHELIETVIAMINPLNGWTTWTVR